MLGHKLVQVLAGTPYRVYGTVRSSETNSRGEFLKRANVTIIPGIDVDSMPTIERMLREIKPTAVLNCIGLIKQLPDAKKAVPSIKVNSLFPHAVAEIARKTDSRFIHFSTDCVYSGSKGYSSEEDPTDPQDLYGKSKALGEVAEEGSLTIRSSIVGPELNSQHGLFEWFVSQKGRQVKGYRKALYSGLSTLEMSKLVVKLLDEHPTLSGIYNVASNVISKFEILNIINEYLDLGIQIEADDTIVSDRSLNGKRFRELTGYAAPDWPAMLKEMVQDPEIQMRFQQGRT
jgi:dTDP-4-dehydrorhamnose reductase